jgi:hypothetical protein
MTREESNEAVANAPGTIELGGRTYLVSQPTDQTFAALHKFLRERQQSPIQAVADDLKYLPPEYRRMAIDAAVALKAGGGSGVTEEFARQQLMEPHGCAYLLYLLIRPEQPDTTLETIRALVTPDNVMDLYAKLHPAAGLAGLDAGKANGRGGSPPGGGPTAAPTTSPS